MSAAPKTKPGEFPLAFLKLPIEQRDTWLRELAEKINASGHSVFSPSGSAMWLSCSGSLIANMMEPDSCSYEAAEGTVAHGIAEEWLRTKQAQYHRVGDVVEVVEHNWERFQVKVDRVMLDYIHEYVMWCEDQPGEHYIETRVDFSRYTPIPNQSGTADHAACSPGKLVITDLKYGKGIQVYAVGNSQALIYALGFFWKYDHLYHFETIEVRICQPRLDHYDVWEVTREELLAFGEHVLERAARCWQIDAPRKPSAKGCQWCRAKSTCVALAKMQDDLLEGRFEAMDKEYTAPELEDFYQSILDGTYKVRPITVRKLTNEQLARLRPMRQTMESWWRSVEDTLERRALDGDQVPGMKLVAGRTDRKFRDEDEAADWLEVIGLPPESIRKTTMRSPAQIEEELINELGYTRKQATDLIASLVVKPQGRPTLVLNSDKRQTLDDKEECYWDEDDFDSPPADDDDDLFAGCEDDDDI